MGVDSGLPDFRGDEGFWRAYPPLKQLGLNFYDMADPHWFRTDPEQAWGFYGHRLQLYRSTQPHNGYSLLKTWCQNVNKDSFVFTSNVDGHFQTTGFLPENILECHGSIHHLQCSTPCRPDTWPAGEIQIEVDPATFRARDPLPRCPYCEAIARPNILMFQDYQWNTHRTRKQARQYENWLTTHKDSRITVIEIGAGTTIPTVRHEAERIANLPKAQLVRINPREYRCLTDGIGIQRKAKEAIEQLDQLIP